MIAFASAESVDPNRNNGSRSADQEIVVVQANGSGRRQLTRNRYEDAYPSWSPDGTKLLFHRGIEEAIRIRHTGVWLIDADGTHERPVVLDPKSDDDNVGEAVWSHDGSRIAFERNSDIYVTKRDGTNVYRLTHCGCAIWDFAWSPDERRFAVVGQNEIRVVDADGDGNRQLVSDNVHGELAWSPDGTRLVFTDDADQLNVVKADGSGLRVLPHAGYAADYGPSWSPDGTKIVFARWREGGRVAIELVNADLSGLSRLAMAGSAPIDNPMWSPDGRKIVFVHRYSLDDPGEIFTMNADGSGARRLSAGEGCCPAWQPVQR